MNEGVNCLIFAGCSGASTLVKSAGPYRIATELRSAGYTVQVVDLADDTEFNIKYKLVLKKFVGKNTLWVGFSNTFLRSIFGTMVFSSKEEEVLFHSRHPNIDKNFNEFINYTRSINPNVKFIAGGVRTFNLEKYGFYLLKGHTDKEVVDFTDKCRKNEEIKTQVIANREFKNFRTCNIVFQKNDVFNNEQFLPVEISRGCIFKCKFCNFPLNGKKKFDYIRDYSILRDEFIWNYEKFGITNYVFSDDTYNDSITKVKELYDNVFSKLSFKIKFITYMRLDLIMRFTEMAHILAESGLTNASFGIETLDYDNAKLIGKGVHPREQIEFIHELKNNYWKNYNIKIVSGFIIGLPYDNKKKIQELRDWINSDDNPLDSWRTEILDLQNIDNDINASEFSLNYKKYGYELVSDKNNYQIWKHDKMDLTYQELIEEKSQFDFERKNSDKQYHAGFIMEQKTNLFKDINIVLNTKAKELDKLETEGNLLENYQKEYFKNLMKLELPNEKG